MVWSRMVLVLRILAVIWAVLVGLGGALQYFEIIGPQPKLEISVWIASIILIGVENAGTLLVRHVRANREERTQRIESALKGALLHITQTREVSYQDLGASVYVPVWWDRVRRVSGESTRLKRIVRFRPAGYPQQSGVRWTGAKGAVGECWRTRKHVYSDRAVVAERYGGLTFTDGEFGRVPAATRSGFSKRDFTSIIGKYSEVLAEPIWHGGKDGVLIGVVSIDRAFEENEHPKRILGTKGTRETAATAAASIGSILKPTVIET